MSNPDRTAGACRHDFHYLALTLRGSHDAGLRINILGSYSSALDDQETAELGDRRWTCRTRLSFYYCSDDYDEHEAARYTRCGF
jgi:hypothetical protein